MRVLVTGNNGYIGTVLCGKLLDEGFEVVGLDTNFYSDCDFSESNYKINQIKKDVRDVTKEDLSGVDAIVHLAALSNDPMGALNPGLTSKINYLASVSLAKLARKNKVKRFVFSSSCSVYGVAGDAMIDENGELNPATEYAKSKIASEAEIAKLSDDDFSPVFLRNATVYGVSPRLRVDLVVNNLVGWAFTTGNLKVMSDGSPWRPLIHIQDICEAFIAALKAPRQLIHNQVFNVGKNSENYRVKDIVDAVKKELPACKVVFTGEHGADTRTYRVNFNKISDILGDYFNPSWNIEKGVREIYDAYKANSFTEDDFQSDKFTRLKKIKSLLSVGSIDENLYWKGRKK